MTQNNEFNSNNIVKSALSSNPDPKQALIEIKEQLGDGHSFIIFFAAPSYNPQKISAEFHKAYPKIPTIGCSTAGEIFGGKLLLNSVVAMAFDSSIIKDFHCTLIKNMDDILEVNTAFKEFEKQFKQAPALMDPQKHVGIILTDGTSAKPENIIARINELTEISFTGGAAGDDVKMKNTYVYYNGKHYQNAAILVIIEPQNDFKVLKTESFETTGKIFIATDVDESKRCIKTIDNKPAALFLAEQIGVPIEELKNKFADYSLGHMVYKNAYVHTTESFDKNYNLYLYSAIHKGAEIQLLKTTDIINDLKKFVTYEIRPLPNISAILHFNCISRDLKIRKDNAEKEFEKIFEGLPIIGFATYGEFLLSFINQTSTMLVLYKE